MVPTRLPDDVTALRGVVRILPALAAVGAPNVPPDGNFAFAACRRSTRFRDGAAAGVEEAVALCRNWAVIAIADFEARSILAFVSAEGESMVLLVVRPVSVLLALLATTPSLDFLAAVWLMPLFVATPAGRTLRRDCPARTAAVLLTAVLTDADDAALPSLVPPPSSDSTAAVPPAEMADWVPVGGDRRCSLCFSPRGMLALSDAPPLDRLPHVSSTAGPRSVSLPR